MTTDAKVKKKIRINKYQVFRICIQVFFLLAAPAAFSSAFTAIKSICEKIGGGDALAFTSLIKLLIVLFLITVLFGRFFCGWACAFGTYNDFVRGIGKRLGQKKSIKIDGKAKWLKYLKYGILIFIMALCFTGNRNLITGKSPWDVFSMILALRFNFGGYIIGLVLLILITVGAVFIDRFFCRFLCPLGAIFALISRVPILSLNKDRTDCGKCKGCTSVCIAEISLYELDKVSSGECFRCMRCSDICPRDNVKFSIFGKNIDKYLVSIIQAAVLFSLLYWLGVAKF